MNKISSSRNAAFYPSLYIVIFIGISALCLWKCRIGYAHMDESFFLDIPYRMIQGDQLFVEEWHPTQMSAILLVPFVKLYLLISGSTEGIVLAFRYIFTVVWGLMAVFLYFKFRKFHFIGATVASLAFMLFTPHGLIALSYTSMCILLLLLTTVITVTAQKHQRIQYIICGICFAGAVLCCPYLAVLYFALCIWVLIRRFTIRNNNPIFTIDWPCYFVCLSIGIAIMLIVFCFTVFSRTSISEFIASLKYVLYDPEHKLNGLLFELFMYVFSFVKASRIFPLMIIATAVLLLISKQKPEKEKTCFCLMCAICAIGFIPYNLHRYYFPDFPMFPMILLGVYCALLSKNTIIQKLFWIIYIPGLLYTLCNYLASNTGIYAIASASSVMCIPSIMITSIYAESLYSRMHSLSDMKSKRYKRFFMSALIVLFALQLGTELQMKMFFIFWETEPLSAQTIAASAGPEKGILMTEARVVEYNATVNDMRQIAGDSECRKILFIDTKTYLHLCTEKELASFSSWIGSSVNDNTIKRVLDYYEFCPQKIADTVYVEKQYAHYLNVFTERGYQEEITSEGNFILKRIKNDLFNHIT